MRRTIVACIAMAILAASAVPALAEYPERTITIIHGTRAGGAVDIGTRTWAPYLERCLGEGTTTAVISIPGAGSALGLAELAKGAPDGYTLGILLMPNLATAIVSNPEVIFTEENFEALGNLFGNALTLGVRADSEIQTIEQLVELAKTEPVNVGVAGVGTEDFLMVKALNRLLGLQFVPIPMEGSAQVNPALLGGHIDVAGLSVTSLMTLDGNARALAIGSVERAPEFPDVPTLREKGWDVLAMSSHIIGAPKGLPEDVKAKLSACITSIAADPKFQAEAAERALRLQVMTADEAQKLIDSDVATYKAAWSVEPWM
ncbi:MAG TPA: tripartite tricarboxylate transporter substrate binding protein [Devosia sp.]|nr:tripartite tricarboxylate transporter substrate binding protein [Devosia sp.]